VNNLVSECPISNPNAQIRNAAAGTIISGAPLLFQRLRVKFDWLSSFTCIR
jgi:hypothetical protein